MKKKIVDTWECCYPSNWKGLIVEDAYAHPAKFSNKLIRRIYDHIVAEGWVKPGDLIVDPFGGVALGALDAMRCGLRWRGCELEERFVRWGNANIQFWNRKFSAMPKWCGDAVLLQGDSRYLAQVLSRASGAVSSPPYKTGGGHKHMVDTNCEFPQAQLSKQKYVPGYGEGDDMGISAAISSPPYAEMDPRNFNQNSEKMLTFMYDAYKKSGGGQTFEQFCKTQMKHSEGYQQPYGGLVSSPPYADSINSSNGIDASKMEDAGGPKSQVSQETKYGVGSAQLGAMKATEKGFQASVTSPPFQATTGGTNVTNVHGPLADPALFARHAAGNMNVGYGETDGNIGTYSPDDFWLSARAIVEQVYQVLEPGAHAVWVLKDYVKGGKRVEFCVQWQQMCEAVGFVTLHEHHAMLVRHKGLSTTDMETGEKVSHEVSSKSFFRRIAEKKGSPPIDYEVILCMVKPA